MEGIYEVGREDGLTCHDIHEDWFWHPKVHRRKYTFRQQSDFIRTYLKGKKGKATSVTGREGP
jgi:hypothetical protein